MPRRRILIRCGLVALLLAGVVALVIATEPTTYSGHTLYVTLPDATDVVAGQYIKAAGADVGQVDAITAVDGGHAARLKLTLDDRVWPLPRGSSMQLRWGGTVAFVNRYILLTRGTKPGPAMASNGVFPASSFSTPVEFDSFVGTFTSGVRANLKQFLGNAGITLSDAGPQLRRAIEAAPPALAQTADAIGDVDDSEAALNGLVQNGARVVDAVNRADPGIAPLVSGAATTFAALADRAAQLRSTLATAPSTLAQTRQTLAQAQPTLRLAQSVAARIAPGVSQLHRIAAPLDGLLTTLRSVGPDALGALRAASAAAPSLNPLLVKATADMPQLRSIARQSVTSLDCIRPYIPDIIAFASDWTDMQGGVDGKDHLWRAQVQSLVPAPINIQGYNSGQMEKLLPWVQYAFPEPPGFAAGQPWFLQQCGMGPSTLNAADDPENQATSVELPPADATPISLPESPR